MKKLVLLLGLMLLSIKGYCLNSSVALIPTAGILVSSDPVTPNTAAIVTITTPTGQGAYSTGYSIYLADLHIVSYATGTVAGIGTPLTCSITGFPVAPALTFQTAQAIGTAVSRDFSFSAPIQANPATQVVITCPAKGGIQWDLTAVYYVGP